MLDGCRRNGGDREYVEGHGKRVVFYICSGGVRMHGAIAGGGEELWNAVESGEGGEGGREGREGGTEWRGKSMMEF
jgi:hypothetical protein